MEYRPLPQPYLKRSANIPSPGRQTNVSAKNFGVITTATRLGAALGNGPWQSARPATYIDKGVDEQVQVQLRAVQERIFNGSILGKPLVFEGSRFPTTRGAPNATATVVRSYRQWRVAVQAVRYALHFFLSLLLYSGVGFEQSLGRPLKRIQPLSSERQVSASYLSTEPLRQPCPMAHRDR